MPIQEQSKTGESIGVVLRPGPMKWKVLYGDWSEYDSDHYKWEDIPNDDVQKVFLIWADGNQLVSSGVDKYVVQEIRNYRGDIGLRLTYWKDENPEEKDPYFEMGRSRVCWPDKKVTDDTGYVRYEILKKSIPDKLIKRGKYLDTETAKAFGIL